MSRHPICKHCKKPMMCGQTNGSHYVCDGRVPPARSIASPFYTGMGASQSSAHSKWSPFQQRQVDAAINVVATRLGVFTADDVWAHLGEGFPVTKGLAARLNVAARRGLIRNTGNLAFAGRGGAHDHAQRLTVWCKA
jgi:hypothetical protein